MPNRLQEWVVAKAARFGVGLYKVGSAWRAIEPEQLRRFFTSFQVDCVFDVGANEGQYAQSLRDLGYRGRILSFEPNPDVFAVVEKKARSDKAWDVFEIALDSHERTIEFNIMNASQFSSLHQPDHSATGIFVGLNTVARTVPVHTKTLDGMFPSLRETFGFQRPFLKMDTQGHDLEVVKGAAACISSFVGLQSELALTALYAEAPEYHEVIRHYQQLGFKLSSLIPNNAGHFPDLNEVDCLMYNQSVFERMRNPAA